MITSHPLLACNWMKALPFLQQRLLVIKLPIIVIELKRKLGSKTFHWPQTVLSDCTPQG